MTAGRATVVERRDVTRDLFVLRLHPDAPLAFTPGQYCTVGVETTERPYSIVSAPHEPTLELFVERVAGGALSPALARLRPGDTVTLRPRAKGTFTLDPTAPDHLMVATVTGIAPFVSIVRDAVHRGLPHRRFVVLHGAAHAEDLAYRDELEALAARHETAISYLPTVSRPADPRNRAWHGRTGRVTAHLQAAIDDFALTPTTAVAYACGNPAMVTDVARNLGARGFAVHEERFWPD